MAAELGPFNIRVADPWRLVNHGPDRDMSYIAGIRLCSHELEGIRARILKSCEAAIQRKSRDPRYHRTNQERIDRRPQLTMSSYFHPPGEADQVVKELRSICDSGKMGTITALGFGTTEVIAGDKPRGIPTQHLTLGEDTMFSGRDED